MIRTQGKFTITGSMISLAITGPLGFIVGYIIGHGIDTLIEPKNSSHSDTSEPVVHTCLIALSAKLIDDPAIAFETLGIPNHRSAKRIEIFKQIQNDQVSIDPYVYQLADQFKKYPQKLANILDQLFKLVIVDRFISQQKLNYLFSLAQIFNLTHQFEHIKSAYTSLYPIIDLEPYQVLGLTYTETDENIKNRYLQLINEYHPDRSIAMGLPQDIIDERNLTLSNITVAYDAIKKTRRFQHHP